MEGTFYFVLSKNNVFTSDCQLDLGEGLPLGIHNRRAPCLVLSLEPKTSDPLISKLRRRGPFPSVKVRGMDECWAGIIIF